MRTIVHLIDSWGPGGAETVFVDLVTGLDPSRYRSWPIVVANGWLHDTLTRARLEPRIIATHRAFDLSYVAKLARVVRSTRADMIHSHTVTSNVYASLAGLWTRVPVLSTLHGLIDLAPDDRRRRIKFGIIKAGSPRVACVSEYLRKQLLATTSIPADRTVVVHNGIDASRFRPQAGRPLRNELGLGDDDFLIGAVGNTRPEKGYDVLLESAALLQSRLPRGRVAIVGEQQQPHAEALLRRRAELGLEDRVAFIGYRTDMPEILASLDCFVVTSRAEGFSLATIQAMACGVPVVASRCGGPEEIVTDGVDGILVPVGDAAATADAVERLAASVELRRRLADAGRMRALASFSTAAMVTRYQDLYDTLTPASE
jgi:glycosyltransferase involved in cell wall biosynthesis